MNNTKHKPHKQSASGRVITRAGACLSEALQKWKTLETTDLHQLPPERQAVALAR